jgi:hypothetical protein
MARTPALGPLCCGSGALTYYAYIIRAEAFHLVA